MSTLVELLPVPYDDGTFWRRGAKEGPRRVLEEFGKIREWSVEQGRSLNREGIRVASPVDINPYDRAASLQAIEDGVAAVVARGAAPYVIGGDHSITLCVLRALAKRYGKGNLSIVHFDAHSDTFGPICGYEYHHGAPFRHIVDEGLVEGARIVQIGLRGAVRQGSEHEASKRGIRSATATDLWRARNCLRELCELPSGPTYVSFDIDVVDPAYAPGTGTPVPGGLSAREALDVVRQLSGLRIVGADLVEVSPPHDSSGITAMLAASILFESLVAWTFEAGPSAGRAT
jgi:agmatinase